jgi:hypothetical protein
MPKDKKEEDAEMKRCKAKEEEAETEVEKAPVEEEDEEEKMRMKKEDEEADEESEEEKKKKKTKKGELGGENPQEDTASATDANSSVSPNMGVPSTQNVFVPSSSTKVGREASSGSSLGQSPSEVSYGKSADTDLTKSPLFVELSAQLDALKKSFEQKLVSVEKSVSDRVANLQKTAGEMEKFYKQSFYKAVDADAAPEAGFKKKASMKEQVESGKVQYSF